MTPFAEMVYSGSRRFLRWWSGELKAVAHDAMSMVAPTWTRSITVFLDKGSLKLLDNASGTEEPLLEIAYDLTSVGLIESLSLQIAATLKDGGRAHLVVSNRMAFVRPLRLPIAALPHLTSAVSLQLPKLLPLSPDQLLTATELISTDSHFGLIELAALKRAEIEPVIKAITAAGLRVASIRLTDDPKASSRFRFQLSDTLGQQSKLRRVDRMLIGTAVGLGLACTAVATTQSYRAEHALFQAQSHIRSTAAAALDRRQQLLNKLEPLAALSDLENRPALAPLLAEITVAVPQDTWVTTFEVKDRRLRLVGVTPDSATLVKALSGAPSLNDVELHSSMSAGIGTGKDRFEIVAEIKGGSP